MEDTTYWTCISIPTDYTINNKPDCNLDLIITKDSIVGDHCFVSGDGNFIDCCVDSPSLRLGRRKNTNQFYGRFSSCYDTLIRNVEVTLINDTLLSFVIAEHDVSLTNIIIGNEDTFEICKAKKGKLMGSVQIVSYENKENRICYKSAT